MAAPVGFAVVADDPLCLATARAVLPETDLRAFTRDELRPGMPLRGALFDALAAQPRHAVVGLVVPVVLTVSAPPSMRGGHAPLVVADHVNLTLASPLAGRWPPDCPRVFPDMSGLYQPPDVRPDHIPPIYSAGVVAGVGDARRLTSFEAKVVRDGRFAAVSDVLVPAAVIAAYHGLRLAAFGVP